MIKKYVDYIKNNPEGYWFKRKLYGWGWTPAMWQGWAVIAGFLIVILYIAVDVDRRSHSASDMFIGFFAPLIVAIGILIYICYKKGESPRWQWGIPKD